MQRCDGIHVRHRPQPSGRGRGVLRNDFSGIRRQRYKERAGHSGCDEALCDKRHAWVFDAPIQTSGAALKWFIETLGAEEREYAAAHEKNIYTYLNELALESAPGSNGLFFFPYLLGERAPLWNEYARGMFIGMDMDMKRSDLIRSVFEGTAYALRHVMETVKASGAKAKVLRICGGRCQKPYLVPDKSLHASYAGISPG